MQRHSREIQKGAGSLTLACTECGWIGDEAEVIWNEARDNSGRLIYHYGECPDCRRGTSLEVRSDVEAEKHSN